MTTNTNITHLYEIEFNKIHPDWLKFFDQHKEQEFMNSFKNYVIRYYTDNKNVRPMIQDLFNPFKFCSPYDVRVIILNQTADNKSKGLAFSSDISDVQNNKAIEKIEDELTKEYQSNIKISDPTFQKLASQGVFMPIIHLFSGVKVVPTCVDMFWEYVLKFIKDLGNNIWFAWGDNETFINKILDIKEDNLNKKKPDEKIIVNTNVKIRDNIPTGKSFKGLGCFMLCNHYLQQYHRKPIKWNNI